MGFFSGLLGIESETDVEKVQEALEEILGDSENVELAYKLIRDLFVFTKHRRKAPAFRHGGYKAIISRSTA